MSLMDNPEKLTREQLLEMVKQIDKLHYQADDDPGGPPYCPECQAYDGTGSPCATRALLDGEPHSFGTTPRTNPPN